MLLAACDLFRGMNRVSEIVKPVVSLLHSGDSARGASGKIASWGHIPEVLECLEEVKTIFTTAESWGARHAALDVFLNLDAIPLLEGYIPAIVDVCCTDGDYDVAEKALEVLVKLDMFRTASCRQKELDQLLDHVRDWSNEKSQQERYNYTICKLLSLLRGQVAAQELKTMVDKIIRRASTARTPCWLEVLDALGEQGAEALHNFLCENPEYQAENASELLALRTKTTLKSQPSELQDTSRIQWLCQFLLRQEPNSDLWSAALDSLRTLGDAKPGIINDQPLLRIWLGWCAWRFDSNGFSSEFILSFFNETERRRLRRIYEEYG